jgi:Holliday junction resolvase RusA-like endonuclease
LAVRDDLDKLVRCTVDGLVKGVLLLDDRHVTVLPAEQAWAHADGREGCRVTVWTVTLERYPAWRWRDSTPR